MGRCNSIRITGTCSFLHPTSFLIFLLCLFDIQSLCEKNIQNDDVSASPPRPPELNGSNHNVPPIPSAPADESPPPNATTLRDDDESSHTILHISTSGPPPERENLSSTNHAATVEVEAEITPGSGEDTHDPATGATVVLSTSEMLKEDLKPATNSDAAGDTDSVLIEL